MGSALLLLAASTLAQVDGEAELPPVGAPPAVAAAPRQEIEAWFESVDGNRDNVVTAAEFDGFFAAAITGEDDTSLSQAAGAALRTYFDQMDGDGSGTVTLAEFVRFHDAE